MSPVSRSLVPPAAPRPVGRVPIAITLLFGAACAATTAPTPPPQETVLVLNGGERTITLLPVDPDALSTKVSLGAIGGAPLDVTARDRTALVAGGRGDVLLVLDLVAGRVVRSIPLAAGSGASGVLIVNDSLAYVTNPGLNTVTRVNYRIGDTASVAVGQFPRQAVLARGRLFVLNANVEPCPPPQSLCTKGQSWLTVVDPIANTRAQGRDSIPLPGPGNGTAIEAGGDGLLYVMNAGDGDDEAGRLSIVDPVRREEVGNFGGFGGVPWRLASDGRERLFVTSVRDGLMEFNTRTRRVVRGAGNGIPVQDIVAVAVDGEGRVYAIEAGNCATNQLGRVRVFRPDLTELRTRPVGICPTGATVVKILLPPPPES